MTKNLYESIWPFILWLINSLYISIFQVCMNCGRSDHADLSIPEKCPHPPATDEFVLAQIKKHQEDSVGVDSLPEDDATVRELIKTELTGSDILSIQLKNVVPSNDPTECIWWVYVP